MSIPHWHCGWSCFQGSHRVLNQKRVSVSPHHPAITAAAMQSRKTINRFVQGYLVSQPLLLLHPGPQNRTHPPSHWYVDVAANNFIDIMFWRSLRNLVIWARENQAQRPGHSKASREGLMFESIYLRWLQVVELNRSSLWAKKRRQQIIYPCFFIHRNPTKAHGSRKIIPNVCTGTRTQLLVIDQVTTHAILELFDASRDLSWELTSRTIR